MKMSTFSSFESVKNNGESDERRHIRSSEASTNLQNYPIVVRAFLAKQTDVFLLKRFFGLC